MKTSPALCSVVFFLFALSACAGANSPPKADAPATNDGQSETGRDAPEDSTPRRTWKIGVISDMNRSYGSTSYDPALTKAINYLRDNSVSLVLSTGDMVAGQKSGLNYDAMWSSFHKNTTLELQEKAIPFLPSAGNHDASAGSSFRLERQKYIQTWSGFPIDRFNSGRPDDHKIKFVENVEQNYPLNYAVHVGPAVFVALDATLTGGLINNQIDWLDEVLKKTADSRIKIIFGHMPLYPFAFDRAHESLAQGTAGSGFHRRLENLLEEHRVSFFLSGHHHVYYPGKRSGNVKFVSVPLLGTGARYLLTSDRSVKNRSPQGFLTIEFDDDGNLSMKAIRTSDMTEIQSASLPVKISVPTSSASDCQSCGSFPLGFFLDTGFRSLYERF